MCVFIFVCGEILLKFESWDNWTIWSNEDILAGPHRLKIIFKVIVKGLACIMSMSVRIIIVRLVCVCVCVCVRKHITMEMMTQLMCKVSMKGIT